MLRGVIVFGAGVYTGMYISQNYDAPKVDDPKTIVNKFKNYLEDVAKDNGKK